MKGRVRFFSNGNVRPFAVVLSALATIALIIALIYFSWPRLREWRAENLARSALTQLDAGDFSGAQHKAQAAFLMAPSQPEVLRCLAHLNARAGLPEALPFFAALEQRSVLTPEDELAKARALLAAGWTEECGRLLERLQSGQGETATWRLLCAEWHLARGEIIEAIAVLSPANIPADVEPGEWQLRRLTLAWKVGDSPQKEAARVELRSLLVRPEADRFQVVALLAADPAEPVPPLLAALASLPPSVELRLLQAGLQLRVAPSDRETILECLAYVVRDDAPDDRRLTAVWLARQGAHAQVLELLPAAEAIHRNDLLLVRLDSLASLRRWREVEDAISRSSLAEPIKRLFLARVQEETNRPELASLNYQQATRLVQKDPQTLTYVANYLERVHRQQLAEDVWTKLAAIPAHARTAMQNIARLQRETKDTKGYRRTIDAMAVRWPMILPYRLEKQYLRLLLDPTDESVDSEMQALRGKFPKTPFVQVMVAFSLLKESSPSAAWRAMVDSPLDASKLPPSQKVMVVAVLTAHKDTRAATLAQNIPRDSLLPEEMAILANAEKSR